MPIVETPILSISLECIKCSEEMYPDATKKPTSDNFIVTTLDKGLVYDHLTSTRLECPKCKYKVLLRLTSLLRTEV